MARRLLDYKNGRDNLENGSCKIWIPCTGVQFDNLFNRCHEVVEIETVGKIQSIMWQFSNFGNKCHSIIKAFFKVYIKPQI